MNQGEGKAFVRKFPKNSPDEATTMLLVLIRGDVEALTNEAMHAIKVSDNGDGSLRVEILGKEETDKFLGYRADQIITAM